MITDARAAIIAVAYLISAILFIFGLKRLSSPATARHGNRLAILAMTIAVAVTLLDRSITWKPINIAIIVVGTAIGAVVGVYFARTVQMTAMPQMVALFNGMGGGTAAFVSVAEFLRFSEEGSIGAGEALSVSAGTAIGALSLTGSLIAFGKLQELISGRPIRFPGLSALNVILFVAILALGDRKSVV